jgi:hypothetical protein
MVLPDAVIARLSHSEAVGIGPDLSVLGYSVALAVVACLIFGLAPALHATHGDVNRALKQEPLLRSTRLSLRGVLLFVQVALSVTLLVAAGLLVRVVQHVGNHDLGFVADDVSVVSVDLPASAYAGPRTDAFTRQLVALLQSARACRRWPPAICRRSRGGTTCGSFDGRGRIEPPTSR